jgi:hypothetical protein
MRLVLVSNIYYELVVETSEGLVTSEYFTSTSIPRNRRQAINRFLELTLSDELRPDEIFVTLYARYLPSAERLEILSSASYLNKGDTLPALEKEVIWFQKENLAVNLAIFNHAKPQQIIILWPRYKNAHMLLNNSTSVLLADHYWVFLHRKREILRCA